MRAAAHIAAKLGDAKREGRNWRCRCPLHGGCSLTLADGRDGRLLVTCYGGNCDRTEVLAELRRQRLIGNDYVKTASFNTVRAANNRDAECRIEIARQIWIRARDARGSPVVAYFATRYLTLAPPPSLRWVPSLRRPDGTCGPAMVARVDGRDGELLGVHRTYLARDSGGIWRRRDRASLGPIGGGAVRLAPAAGTLLIGEGIETTLAGMVATGLPGWAGLSTVGLVALALPSIVRDVVILADHDASGAGEQAAIAAAARWLAEGRHVRIALPPRSGIDFADVLAGRCHMGVREVRNVAA